MWNTPRNGALNRFVKPLAGLFASAFAAWKALRGRSPESSPILRESRLDQRFPVLLDAEILMEHARQPVMVRDLSTNGVMLSGDDLPPVGAPVTVMLAATKLFGTIVWSRDGYCGLRLRLPIRPLQIVRDVTREHLKGADSIRSPNPSSRLQ